MDRRELPKNIPAERTILGAIMQSPLALVRVLGEGLEADHFYRPEHGALFELLAGMDRRGEPITLITVPEVVARSGQQERYGGVAYVVQLPDQVVSTANVEYYAECVIADWRRRSVLTALDEAREAMIAGREDSIAVADKVVADVLSLSRTTGQRGFRSFYLAVDEALEQARAAYAAPAEHGGISTGFRDLDRLTGGLHAGNMIVLAARPGMGKSALAMQIAEHVARDRNAPGGWRNVAIFALEMKAVQLGLRALGTRSRVSAGLLRTGRISDDLLGQVEGIHDRLRRDVAPIYVDDTRGVTISQVCARARALEQRVGPLGAVIVDYLQLLRGELGGKANREQEVAHASSELAALAGDLDTTVIALSQLNRSCESRPDKRPKLSDLRESGSLEQDADQVAFVFRPSYYSRDPKHTGKAEIILAKNRHGPTGVIDLNFEEHLTRFYDLTLAQIQAASRPVKE